jgi:hypothetical protein
MTQSDKAIIEGVIREQQALLQRCEALGLLKVAFKMSMVIDELEITEGIPARE